ncbi:hypothetical protein [Halobacillus sp. B29]|uniref:hypothetical protein n=1 Tax=Halobacillus sp. B29 TaxID=3457432 RepID=UPI003FCC46EB
MKKIVLLLLVLVLHVLVACSEGEAMEKEKSGKEIKQEEKENVSVDKGLMNVEVTLPSSLVESENMEEMKAGAKEKGIKNVTQNDDGSITYKMSKSVHKKLMGEIETQLKETVEEIKNTEDFTSIQDITHTKNFSNFTMKVDREAYENSMDGFASLGLGMSGMMYQLYNGENPETYEVTIEVEDASSGEVFDEIIYPEALENMGSDSE